MTEAKLVFELHQNPEKKHSRRFTLSESSLSVEDEIILRDIYVMRPWSDGVKKIKITIEKE